MFNLSPQEMIMVAVVAVLLFGKRLPEVGRSLGQSFMEFKRGMQGIEQQIHGAGSYASNSRSSYHSSYDPDEYQEAAAPKFDPPPAEPEVAAAPKFEAPEAPKFQVHS